MKTMKIELKNIQHAEFASEETHCYEASLYVNGKRVAVVSNDGHGGADMIHVVGKNGAQLANSALVEEAKQYLAENADHDYGPEAALEIHCSDLVNEWLIERDVKRSLSRNVMFVKPDAHGVFYFKGTKAGDAQRAQDARPDVTVLNLLPIKQAVELWKENAAA